MVPRSPFSGGGPFQPQQPGGGLPTDISGPCSAAKQAMNQLLSTLQMLDTEIAQICGSHDQNQRRQLCLQLSSTLTQVSAQSAILVRQVQLLIGQCR